MMKTLLLTIGLLISSLAQADAVWLDRNLMSVHASNTYTEIDVNTGYELGQRKFNENNNGWGITVERKEFSVTGGYYKNSVHKKTIYLGMVYETNNPVWNVGITGGAATGYVYTITPMLVPSASVTIAKRFKITSVLIFAKSLESSAIALRASIKLF